MKTQILTRCALFAALHCVCAWLSIPLGDIAVTLQTFSMVLCLLILGGKWGCVSIFAYLVLGAVGLPVFSGFRGGIGHLLGVTGGYLWGFLLGGLVFWVFGGKHKILASILSVITCYICGSLWFWLMFTPGGVASLSMVLLKCVVPFLIPDAMKIALALFLAKRIQTFLEKNPSP